MLVRDTPVAIDVAQSDCQSKQEPAFLRGAAERSGAAPHDSDGWEIRFKELCENAHSGPRPPKQAGGRNNATMVENASSQANSGAAILMIIRALAPN
jgi:hypothetical protein